MPLNILIVDDSSVMRAMIARVLRLSGIPLGALREASDGAAALQVLRSGRVDLALVDVNMPVMDGEALIERVRADAALRRLPIIVVSTESSETRIERIRRHGVAFIHKPFTPERLRDTILQTTGAADVDRAHLVAQGSGGTDF